MSGGISESWKLADITEDKKEAFWNTLLISNIRGSIGVVDGVSNIANYINIYFKIIKYINYQPSSVDTGLVKGHRKLCNIIGFRI
jgi:hypothetical protein